MSREDDKYFLERCLSYIDLDGMSRKQIDQIVNALVCASFESSFNTLAPKSCSFYMQARENQYLCVFEL